MSHFTSDLHISHIITQIELRLFKYLQLEVGVKYPTYTSDILADKNKAIGLHGDIVIVFSVTYHPEVWVCMVRAESNQIELI